MHYAIDLALDPETLKVDGFEVIDIEVREPTARVVLNADEIKIIRATVDRQPRGAAIAYDDDDETVTLTFPRPLEVGHHQLRIAFTAQIHRSGDGLYYVDYRADGVSKRLISSHMAPADTRRVFPVWDEPSLKATFALTVTVPRAYHRRQQHAGRARGAGRPERQEDLLHDHAEDVELSRPTHGGRARADQRRGRRRRDQCLHHGRQARAGTIRACRARSTCCATSTTISA